jgi:hypothetical protein
VKNTAYEARFRHLFDGHHCAVMAYFMRRISAEADAPDGTENVLLAAWHKLNTVPQLEWSRLEMVLTTVAFAVARAPVEEMMRYRRSF